VPGTVNASATSFSVVRGTLVSGGIPETQFSDDQYLRVQSGIPFTPLDPAMQLVLRTTSPFMHPNSLQFKAETGVSIPGLVQTIALFNNQTNSWEELDSRGATTADGFVTVTPGGDQSRFVNQTTGQVQARISVIEGLSSLGLSWQFRLDLGSWTFTF
jgi:hypothetical protein